MSQHPDLAKQHQPVTNLFPQPASEADWNQYRLSDDQVLFFHEHGYLKGIRVLNDEQVAVLRKELAEIADPRHPGHELFYEFHSNESADPSKVLFHCLGHWRITPGFHDLLWNPALVMPASQLLGGSVRFWHDQLFCKPAHHGGVVAWHQDYSYWTRTQPMAHLTCWIALDDSNEANGCLRYIPASHRWPLLPMPALAGDMDGLREVLNEEQIKQFNNEVLVEVKAGECAFHHPLLVHGSKENRSERSRRAAVMNYVRDGVISAKSESLLHGVPPLKEGETLGGKFFPLLK
ncbi:MAG: phytanoyl-CoA dioxygenase family protein [Planctomycetia bacterium]|nr:phytanoyl-CoA dioxygenase family protein [Planctomycetia bacterium]